MEASIVNQNYLFMNASMSSNNQSLLDFNANFFAANINQSVVAANVDNENVASGGKDLDTTASSFNENFFKITQQITGLYLMPLISTFGIFGNIIIVIVYSKSKLSSTNFYLITLSLSDILKLANDFLYFIVTLINKFDEELGTKIFTDLYLYSHFIFLFTAINTSWLTTFIALDRYIAIVRNQRLTPQPGYFKTAVANLIIFILSAVISLPSSLFLKYGSDSSSNSLNANSQSNSTTLASIFSQSSYKKVYNIFNSAIKAFIPLILIVYLDYKIISFVYKNKMKKQKQSKSNSSKSRVSLMLITIVSVFTICMFPDAIMTMMNMGYANESYLVRAIREITDLLLAINSASTFPICFYFSIQFRIEFKQIFLFWYKFKSTNNGNANHVNKHGKSVNRNLLSIANANQDDVEQDDVSRFEEVSNYNMNLSCNRDTKRTQLLSTPTNTHIRLGDIKSSEQQKSLILNNV